LYFKVQRRLKFIWKKIKPTGAHLLAAHLPFNRATRLLDPAHTRHKAGHLAVTLLTAKRVPVSVTAVIADPVSWRPYPRAHGSRVEPSTFSVTRALLLICSLPPRHTLCSSVTPPTAAPHRCPCQGSTPLSPSHQLGPICNSKRRLSKLDYRDHQPPLLPRGAHRCWFS
jgi:hypothetical protein